MGSPQRGIIRRGCPVGEVIRRTKGGKFIGFYLRWYEGGKRRLMASKQPTQAEARKMLLQIEAKIARGEAGISERRTDWPSVSELIERFCTEYSRPRIKDIEKYRAQYRCVLQRVASIGHLSAAAVTPETITRLREAHLRRFAPGTVRMTLAALSVAFAWGVRQGLAPSNPCRGVERPSAPHALDFLTREEVAALLQYARERAPELHPMIATALHTGLRKGELCGLRWQDLDIPTRRLTVARSYRSTPKSGKARHLRLPDVLVPVLTEWRQHCPKTAEGLVFPKRRRKGGWGMSTLTSDMLGLPALLRAAGVRELPHPWHAMRHTFASHFVMAGGSILALSKLLGHSDVNITLIYAHLAPDFLGDEMNRVKF